MNVIALLGAVWVAYSIFRLAGAVLDGWGEEQCRTALVQYHQQGIIEAGGVWRINAAGERYFVKARPRT